MTAAATQRIINRLRSMPDDRETMITDLIAMIEPEEPEDREAEKRRTRADAFLASFMNVEIDEQAIRELRERSTI